MGRLITSREGDVCPICNGQQDPRWGICLNCDGVGRIPKRPAFTTPNAIRLSRTVRLQPWQYFVAGMATTLIWALVIWGMMHFPPPTLSGKMNEEKAITALIAACSYIYQDEE